MLNREDMTQDSAAVQTLKKYARDKYAILDSGALQTEILNASDRAAVILIAALLDDALEFILLKNMRSTLTQKEYENAFRADGPLGSFSSRISPFSQRQ